MHHERPSNGHRSRPATTGCMAQPHLGSGAGLLLSQRALSLPQLGHQRVGRVLNRRVGCLGSSGLRKQMVVREGTGTATESAPADWQEAVHVKGRQAAVWCCTCRQAEHANSG